MDISSSASSASSVVKPFSLPPLPSLEDKHFAAQSVKLDGLPQFEVLRPAAAPYLCADPLAPALLLVPGLGMDCLGWLRQLPLGALAHLHFIQVSNDAVAGERGLGHFARVVEAYIQHEKLDERPGGVILGGCSMGGSVSLAVAIRKKVKLRGLALIGTFGSCRHLPWWQRTLAPLAYAVPYRVGRIVAWNVVGRLHRFGRVRLDEAQWIVSCRLRRTAAYFGRSVMALTRQEQIAAVRELGLPAVIVHGQRDRVLPLAAGEELSKALNAPLVALPDAGHALFFTHADAVNAAVAEFLTAVAGGS